MNTRSTGQEPTTPYSEPKLFIHRTKKKKKRRNPFIPVENRIPKVNYPPFENLFEALVVYNLFLDLPFPMANDQLMWGNNRAVAPTPGAAIVAVDLGDNFTVKGRGTIIQIFYHGLDETTQAILDAERIFLYKTPNEAHQLLKDRVLLKLDLSKDMKAKPIRKTVAFAESSNDSKLMEKMKSLTTKIDSQFKDIKGEMKEMRDGVGLTYDLPVNPNAKTTIIHDDSDDEVDKAEKEVESSSSKQTRFDPPPLKAYKPKIPYPQHLHKEKMEERYAKFIDLIKEVRINVPLVDVLAGMPNYGKLLKDLVSNKSKMEKISAAFLNKECSTIVQNKLPSKLELNLGVGDDRITCLIDKAMRRSHFNDDTCFCVDVIDEVTEEELDTLLDDSKPFSTMSEKISELLLDHEFEEFIATKIEEIPEQEKEVKNNSILPVVISALLQDDEKKRLVSVLKKHKEAFAWKIFDIPGICLSFCKHKINLEDDAKPVIQRQRRLNPNMKEVVKKEIMKLMETIEGGEYVFIN
ncbi:hypothetical protein Tco_0221200 [Tanacetum coccineum]